MNNTNKSKVELLLELNEAKERIRELESQLSERETVNRDNDFYDDLLFTYSDTALVVLDFSNLTFTHANDAAVKIYGFKDKSELIGQTPAIFSTEKQYNGQYSYILAKQIIEKALLAGGNIFEWRHIRPNGEVWDGEVHLISYYQGKSSLMLFQVIDISDRKKKEAQLIESEAFKNALFANSYTSLIVMDSETLEFIDCNLAAVKIYGLESKSDVIGKTPKDMSAPTQYNGEDSIIKAQEYVNIGLENGSVLFEWKHQRPNGEFWDAEVHLMSFQYKDKTLLQFNLRDISEQKALERLLSKEKDLNDTLIQRSTSFYVAISNKGKTLLMNQTMLDATGYQLEEVIGKDYLSIFVPEKEHIGLGLVFQELIKGKRTHQANHVIKKNGEELLIDWFGTPVFNENNEFDYFFGMGIDLTEQRKYQYDLKRSEMRYRSFFETVRNGAFITSQDSILINCNDGLVELLGYDSKEEIIGQSTVIFYDNPDDRLLLRDKIIENAFVINYPITFRKKDNTKVYTSLHAALVKYDSNEFFIHGTLIDVTELRKVEEELRVLNEQLEEKVKLRTNELEQVNKELEEFAYIVSHDLKAPLRGISQVSNWMKSDYASSLDSEGLELLDLLMTRSNKMEKMISAILDYSRTFKSEYSYQETDLDILVNDLVELLQVPANINIEIKSNFPKVWTDPTKIQQVFQNLISNALKYINKEDGLIKLNYEESEDHWIFSVEDNGCGIDEKYHDKIFKLFQKLGNEEEYHSTGIGLTIVQNIIKQFNGKIWLESKVGVGTKFYFTIPFLYSK